MTNAFNIANKNGGIITRRGTGDDFEVTYSDAVLADMATVAIEAARAGVVLRLGENKLGVLVGSVSWAKSVTK